MDEKADCMSKSCAFIEKVALWAQKQPVAPVVYAGKAGHGFGNRPAPQIEICYLQKGYYDRLHIGDLTVSFPCNHVSIHSVHHGNYSDKAKHNQSWCAFLDVSKAEEFQYLYETPVFHLIEVDKPDDLIRAFQSLAIRSRQPDWSSPIYPGAQEYQATQDANAIDPMHRLAINSAVSELLLALFCESKRQASPQGSRVPEVIQQAMDYIELHYCEPETSVSQIAASVHVSPDHFTRMFKKHVGESPVQYLRRVRVGRSKMLLRDSDHQIQNVCWSVGFRDPFHFSKVFREFTGVSPSQYRRNASSEDTDEGEETDSQE